MQSSADDQSGTEWVTSHACLTRHAVCLFLAIQCSQKYYLLTSFSGSAWNLIFAGASNLSYLFHFNLGALVIFRVLQQLSIVAGTDIYYIDTDEIPGLFQWRKFRIQKRYDFYLSHVKISRLSWLLQSQPMKVLCLITIIFRMHINALIFSIFRPKFECA